MLFQVENRRDGRSTHCGVLEFVADEGMVYLPYWVRCRLGAAALVSCWGAGSPLLLPLRWRCCPTAGVRTASLALPLPFHPAPLLAPARLPTPTHPPTYPPTRPPARPALPPSPEQMMENLQLTEGDVVTLRSATLPKGTYVKLQPHSTDFTEISNPRAVLETTLRSFSCLTGALHCRCSSSACSV